MEKKIAEIIEKTEDAAIISIFKKLPNFLTCSAVLAKIVEDLASKSYTIENWDFYDDQDKQDVVVAVARESVTALYPVDYNDTPTGMGNLLSARHKCNRPS